MARQQGARVLLLPSLTGGTNYHWHTGNVQQNDGSMLLTTQQALYVGGGAGNASAAKLWQTLQSAFSAISATPSSSPLAARQRVTTRRFDADATFNSVLLNVSIAYLELMAAEARARGFKPLATRRHGVRARNANIRGRRTRSPGRLPSGKSRVAAHRFSNPRREGTNRRKCGESGSIALARSGRKAENNWRADSRVAAR